MAGEITKAVRKNEDGTGISLVNITPETTARLVASEPQDANHFLRLDGSGEADSVDTIRPGDTLSIAIYEVGVSLFSAQSAAGSELTTQVTNPVASAQRMNGMVVDEAGGIQLPYIGYLNVAGRTSRIVETMIEQRLHGMSQSPRAIVSITESVNSAVYLSGAVNRPGRYRLTAAREHIRGYLAIAGGVSGEPEDFSVRLTRGTQTEEMRLSDIATGSASDVRLLPGDQVEVLRRPRTYTVFGASDKVSQIPFGASTVSFAEAIARAGGPSDARANARGIFLFRMVSDPADGRGHPFIYRLNMMDPSSYFLAQQIALRDKDLIYFSNSPAGPPAKFFGIINQLFGPFVTARALTQ